MSNKQAQNSKMEDNPTESSIFADPKESPSKTTEKPSNSPKRRKLVSETPDSDTSESHVLTPEEVYGDLWKQNIHQKCEFHEHCGGYYDPKRAKDKLCKRCLRLYNGFEKKRKLEDTEESRTEVQKATYHTKAELMITAEKKFLAAELTRQQKMFLELEEEGRKADEVLKKKTAEMKEILERRAKKSPRKENHPNQTRDNQNQNQNKDGQSKEAQSNPNNSDPGSKPANSNPDPSTPADPGLNLEFQKILGEREQMQKLLQEASEAVRQTQREMKERLEASDREREELIAELNRLREPLHRRNMDQLGAKFASTNLSDLPSDKFDPFKSKVSQPQDVPIPQMPLFMTEIKEEEEKEVEELDDDHIIPD